MAPYQPGIIFYLRSHLQIRYKMIENFWTYPRPALAPKTINCLTYTRSHYAFCFELLYDLFRFFFIGKQWLSTFFHIPSLPFVGLQIQLLRQKLYYNLYPKLQSRNPYRHRNPFCQGQSSASLLNGSVVCQSPK
jgi:hypothetical protein